MLKKIATEKDITIHDFKVKTGTIDKKNTEVIYVECGTYIKPNTSKKSYIDDVHAIKKEYRDIIRKITSDNEIFTNDYICTIDCPIERITPNKKSYLTFQYTLQLKNIIPFYDLVHEHQKIFIDNILDKMREILIDYDFSLSKGKK